MSNYKSGGPAFPSPCVPGLESGNHGLTLRDWFAGQMLNAFIDSGEGCDDLSEEDVDHCADWCYKYADAMLKRREV